MSRENNKGTPLKRWSKLQRELYNLISPEINFQIHCVAYRMGSRYGSTDLPRYWITVGGTTIFDYPKNFLHSETFWERYNLVEAYPYGNNISEISTFIREYIDTPKEILFDRQFTNYDFWGLADILKAADRRIDTRRLKLLRSRTENEAAKFVINLRLDNT